MLPLFHDYNVVLSDFLFNKLTGVVDVILQVGLVSVAHELSVLISHLDVGFLVVVSKESHHGFEVRKAVLLDYLEV